MGLNSKSINIILVILFGIVFCYQGCSPTPFEAEVDQESLGAQDENTPGPPSEDTTTPEPTQPPVIEKKSVSVGVGRGGAIMTSHDGFESLIHIEQQLVPGQSYSQTYLKDQCRFGDFSPYAPDHDPHMFRGIAFGNNQFVAIGGCCHVNVRTSKDGETWTEEIILDKESVTYGGCPWAGDITFGNNVFASMGGGTSVWSADGENWQRMNWAGGSRPSGAYRRMEYENGYFMAVGSGNAPLAFSKDGMNWDVNSSINVQTKIAAGLDLFLFVDSSESSQLVMFNTQTEEWETGRKFPSGIGSIYFSIENKTFYLRAGSVNYSSVDGRTWMPMGNSSTAIQGFSGGTFYSFSRSWGEDASSTRRVSSDGLNWKTAEKHQPFNPIIDSITAEVEISK